MAKRIFWRNGNLFRPLIQNMCATCAAGCAATSSTWPTGERMDSLKQSQMIPTCDIITGDALRKLPEMVPKSIQCCITSPPYYGLRDYDHEDQIGNEPTPGEYVKKLVELGREIRRVLRNDGTFWLNLGDSYYNYRPGLGQRQGKRSIAGQKCAEME